MIIQARNSRWDKKLKQCKSIQERNSLILKSGTERVASMFNLISKTEFYRPAIGQFIIHGITESDNFKFNNEDDAIKKGEELHQILISEAN